MHVTRATNQELVILDSSIWLSVGLLCISGFVVYRLLSAGQYKGLLSVGLLVLFALLFWRREVVVFDAVRRQTRWRRLRLFKVAAGTVPFSEITGIGMETTTAKDNVLCYRLTILTANGSVPMADSYAADEQKYEKLRKQILEFLKLDSGEVRSTESFSEGRIADEASIRSLLEQGRRIDAIHLVRSTQNVSLAEATNLVAKIVEEMNITQ